MTTRGLADGVRHIIPPSNPPTCQVELEDPGKAYEAVIGSIGSNFEDIHCVGDPTGPLKRDHPKSVVVGDKAEGYPGKDHPKSEVPTHHLVFAHYLVFTTDVIAILC